MSRVLVIASFSTMAGCGQLPDVQCDFEVLEICVALSGLQASSTEVETSIYEISAAFLREEPAAAAMSREDLAAFHREHEVSLLADNERVAGAHGLAITEHDWNYSTFHVVMRDDYACRWNEAHAYLIHELLHVYSWMLHEDLDEAHTRGSYFDLERDDSLVQRIWAATYETHPLDAAACAGT